MKDEVPEEERLRREMYTHLEELRARSATLIESKYPLDVYNEVHAIRSIVGQLASAAVRWRATQ